MSTTVSPSAHICEGVRIGSNVVIEDDVYIDNDVIIRDNVYIKKKHLLEHVVFLENIHLTFLRHTPWGHTNLLSVKMH